MPSINKQRLRSLFVGEYGVIGILVGVIGAAYFVPTFAAIVQKRDNLPMICGVNALLGWTIVGWIVALMWALGGAGRGGLRLRLRKPSRQPCPSCGRSLRAEARRCRHCGYTLATRE